MRDKKLYRIYKGLAIASAIVLAICFIFRYSFIDFLGFERPLQLAVFFCTTCGIIGSFLALIDGINKNFKGGVFPLLIINILFIATFPILTIAEQAIKPVVNPFDELTPDTNYTTKNRDDAAFILEGKLHEWPFTFSEFLDDGYSYREIKENVISLSKLGDSNYNIKPTWFTSGSKANQLATEAYNIELKLDGKGDLEEQNVEAFKIRSRQNNWDFEVQGFTLLDSIYKLEEKYGDALRPDPDNKNLSLKKYYLDTSDGYVITFYTLQGKIQVVGISKEPL